MAQPSTPVCTCQVREGYSLPRMPRGKVSRGTRSGRRLGLACAYLKCPPVRRVRPVLVPKIWSAHSRAAAGR